MKTLTFIYDQKQKTFQRKSNDTIYSSLEVIKSAQSKSVVDVLNEISKDQPESIYRLALRINRDPSNVLKTCKELELHGIIKLESEIVDGRAVLKPVLLYDSIKFEYSFNTTTQSHKRKR